MKIVTAQEMARVERLAYAEGASEEVFMERAGAGVAEAARRFIGKHHLKPNIMLLCGPGNNAGDAYVAGTLLLKGGFQVRAVSCARPEKRSELCVLQSQRFTDAGGEITQFEESQSVDFGRTELLIDGLLGTGFHGQVIGSIKGLIEQVNRSHIPVIAVDIPSGINGTTGEISETAIQATETVFLGMPKRGCFIPEAWEYTGKIYTYNFGLEEQFIEKAESSLTLIDESIIRGYLPLVRRTRHKYEAGYVVGLGGSPGMLGAPTLACLAALRSGAGIVRLFHPSHMQGEFGQMPLEVIHVGYQEGELDPFIKEMGRASALFFGPGLGLSSRARSHLLKLLAQANKPSVIDADALFAASEENAILPPQTILTPHHGEMGKILRSSDKHLPFSELLHRSQSFVEERKVTLVLKGAPTYILQAGKRPYVCPLGDPGMATAGSGDVLTGIVAGFLAQTKDPLKAALLGVYFHAAAGELAAEKWTSYSMIATDIVEQLPLIFKRFF